MALLGALCLATLLAVAPRAAALDPADPRRYAFVSSQRSSEVVAIDTASDAIAARLRLRDSPHQIFVLEDAGLLVAAHRQGIEIVDLAEGRSQAMIPLGADLMQYHPQSGMLAVADAAAGSVGLLALATRELRARIDGLQRPSSMLFGPDGARLFIANGGRNEVTVVDVAAGRVAERLEVTHPAQADVPSRGIVNLARTPTGWVGVAVPRAADAPLAMIDLHRRTILARLPRGKGPSRGYTTADGAFVMVLNNGDGTISLLSLFTGSESARIVAARDMIGVSTGWFETAAFIVSRDANRVLVLDLINRTLAGAIALPGVPGVAATSADGLKLYVPLPEMDALAVIDTGARKVASLIEGLGIGPDIVQVPGALAFCH